MELIIRLDEQSQKAVTQLRKDNCNISKLINLFFQEYAENPECYNSLVSSTKLF